MSLGFSLALRVRHPAAALFLLACGEPAPPSATALQSAPEPPPVEAGLPAAPGEYQIAVDVVHYEIELSLGAPEIEGRATLAVRPNGAARLPLDFTGLGIRSVTVDGEPSGFDYANGKLVVPLPADGNGNAAASGTEIEVAVHYHGTPDDGLIIRQNVHGAPTAFVDNWPNRTRFWLPSVDHPADKATASFTIHAPNGWQVIANGAQTGDPAPAAEDALGGPNGKTTWRWETNVPHPSYTLVTGAATFAIESLGRAACGNAPASLDPDGCIDVSFWVYPEDTEHARHVFARAPAMVDFFTDLIGPYPFEKLANVQSATRFGGMENSSAIFYSEQAIAAGRLGEGTVSHEIAHQWFGDSATEAEWSHLWLSEGFATYFGALFFEHADGIDEFRRRMEESRQRYLASGDAVRPIVEPGPPESLFDLLNSNNYSKGGWVLHMLRGLLGDATFFAAIRAYYGEHAYGTARTEDLQRVFEEVSDQSLEWFFDQWVRQPGHPELESLWEIDDEGALLLTVNQLQTSEWPTFRFPLDVEIAGDPMHRERLEVTERSHTFRIPIASRPDSIVLDPDGWLLKG